MCHGSDPPLSRSSFSKYLTSPSQCSQWNQSRFNKRVLFFFVNNMGLLITFIRNHLFYNPARLYIKYIVLYISKKSDPVNPNTSMPSKKNSDVKEFRLSWHTVPKNTFYFQWIAPNISIRMLKHVGLVEHGLTWSHSAVFLSSARQVYSSVLTLPPTDTYLYDSLYLWMTE